MGIQTEMGHHLTSSPKQKLAQQLEVILRGKSLEHSIPCQAEGVRTPSAFSSECFPMEGRRCVGAPSLQRPCLEFCGPLCQECVFYLI